MPKTLDQDQLSVFATIPMGLEDLVLVAAAHVRKHSWLRMSDLPNHATAREREINTHHAIVMFVIKETKELHRFGDVVGYIAALDALSKASYDDCIARARKAIPHNPQWLDDERTALVAAQLAKEQMAKIAMQARPSVA